MDGVVIGIQVLHLLSNSVGSQLYSPSLGVFNFYNRLSQNTELAALISEIRWPFVNDIKYILAKYTPYAEYSVLRTTSLVGYKY